MNAVRVFVTPELRSVWELSGSNIGSLIKAFKEWRTDWPLNERKSDLFGKDGEYGRPTIDGKRVLRHVHMVPVKDVDARSKWFAWLKLGKRRTSDRVLVYASDNKGCFLLIYVLEEPGAHDVAEMRTKEHKDTMEGFAATAVRFFEQDKSPA